MTIRAALAAVVLIVSYVTRRVLDEAFRRLSERFADWLLPREQATTYRLTVVVIGFCRVIAPKGSPARRACESAFNDISDISARGVSGEQPAALALSLLWPALSSRLLNLAGHLLAWMFLLALSPPLPATVALIFLVDDLSRKLPRKKGSYERYRREYWAMVWMGVFTVPLCIICVSITYGLPRTIGIVIAAHGFLGAALGTGLTLFADGRQVPQRRNSELLAAQTDDRSTV